MKKILLSECQCIKCNTVFKIPLLGDFSYGEFILWSINREYRYLNTFDDITYKEVIDIIYKYKQETGMSIDVQSIYGLLACDVDSMGNCFYIGNPPCPNCGSINLSVLKITNEEQDVSSVTHFTWDSLEQKDKKLRINTILEGY